jgi:hypothetical protein
LSVVEFDRDEQKGKIGCVTVATSRDRVLKQ